MTIIWAFQSVTDKDFVKGTKGEGRWTSKFIIRVMGC